MKITRKCFDEIKVNSEKELCEVIKSIVQGSFFKNGPFVCGVDIVSILELIFQEIDFDNISKSNIFLRFHFEANDGELDERYYTYFVLINDTKEHVLNLT